MTEWQTVREGDHETVLKVIARHGIRTYEGFPMAGLSTEELRDVYAMHVLTEWRNSRSRGKERSKRVIERLKRTQVLP